MDGSMTGDVEEGSNEDNDDEDSEDPHFSLHIRDACDTDVVGNNQSLSGGVISIIVDDENGDDEANNNSLVSWKRVKWQRIHLFLQQPSLVEILFGLVIK